MENKNKMNQNTENQAVNTVDISGIKGELTYDDKVIQKIIGIALEKVDGLLAVNGGLFSNITKKLVNTENVTQGINIEVGKKEVAVDLDIITEYGKDITKIYEEIKKIVSQEISQMTHLKVVEVNVKASDVKTKEQHEKDSVTVQDNLAQVAESTSAFASDSANKVSNAFNKGNEKIKEQFDSRVE